MAALAALLVALAVLPPGARGVVCEANTGASVSPPLFLPPPKHLIMTTYSMQCALGEPGAVYNNQQYTDGSGPRGAHNASECCAVCAASDGCKFWSFNVDPTLSAPPGQCRWGALTDCCWLHIGGSNLTKLGPTVASNQHGAKGVWTSGTVAPTASTEARAAAAAVASGSPTKTELVLSAGTTIQASDASLLPLAAVMSDDIFLMSGIRMNASSTVAAAASTGDISFVLLPPSSGGRAWQGAPHKDPLAEHYTITVDGKGALVSCHGYTGCAWGATSLLQALCVSGVPHQIAAFPAFNLTDGPVRCVRCVCCVRA
jgi:hypothetical protein